MELQTRKVSDLIPYINNSRTHSEEQINQIISSIKEFGFTNPILLEEENGIIAGHGRLMAVKKMGWTEVPCVTIKGLTKTQIKALNIADNQIALNAGWDLEKLKLEIKGLNEDSFNLDILGFNKNQIDDFLFEEVVGLTDEDAVPEIKENPKSKLGDVFILGNHRLMCGDSTLLNNFDKLCTEQADMIFTDPPYGMSYGGGRAEGNHSLNKNGGVKVKAHGMILNDDLKDDALISLVKDSLTTALLKAKQGCSTYICFTWRTYKEFYDAISNAGLKIKNCIVWDKKSIGLGQSHYRPQHEFIFYCGEQWYGDKAQSDVWHMTRGATSKYVHPTQKPVELVCKAIENSSKNEDIIIDCFGGSGSTLISCEKLNRKARVMELDPKYVDAIILRWQNFTGKEAIHEQSGKRYNEL
jgi:DNA modification methylase